MNNFGYYQQPPTIHIAANCPSIVTNDDAKRSLGHLNEMKKIQRGLSHSEGNSRLYSKNKVCIVKVRPTQASSVQFIVCDDASFRSISGVGRCQNPTRFADVARLPVNSNARTVVHTCC